MKTNHHQSIACRRTASAALTGAAVLFIAGILACPKPDGGERQSPRDVAATATPGRAVASPSSGNPEADREAPATEAPAAAPDSIEAIAAEFRNLAADPSLATGVREEKARGILTRLRAALRGMPADQAAAAIVAFLNSGSDAATGLGFSLEGGGVLADAPSLRTALLDLLGQLDPAAAVEYAQTIFNRSQVADEWALSLRNLGWQNQDGAHTGELRTRLGQLLDNTGWLANPTQGFFEAFDAAVHLGGIEELSSMASVMRLEDSAGNPIENGSTHAAYLALDRITTRHPDQSLTQLADDPSLLAWAPEHRGALMARADVSNPVQLVALENYLTTLAGRPQELETFTSIFPNRNGMLGNALITTPLPETPHDQLLAGDRAALAAVNDWLQSGRFPSIASNLRLISARLSGFLANAASAGGTQ